MYIPKQFDVDDPKFQFHSGTTTLNLFVDVSSSKGLLHRGAYRFLDECFQVFLILGYGEFDRVHP